MMFSNARQGHLEFGEKNDKHMHVTVKQRSVKNFAMQAIKSTAYRGSSHRSTASNESLAAHLFDVGNTLVLKASRIHNVISVRPNMKQEQSWENKIGWLSKRAGADSHKGLTTPYFWHRRWFILTKSPEKSPAKSPFD